MQSLAISKEESILSAEIFARMATVPLIDPYEAFQLLDNEWNKIAVDLEILQTEGFDAVRKVNPNMILKKKDNKEIEVQDGWIGHVIPFALAQEVYLTAETDALHAKEQRLAELAGEFEALLDSMSEEEKQTDAVNDTGDAFVAKEVTKLVKQLKKDGSDPQLLSKLRDAQSLFAEEKSLKADIKKESAVLHVKTKEVIEQMTDEQACELLRRKWIAPLVAQLGSLPEQIISTLDTKVQALAVKYATTFADVDAEIKETEQQLSAMIDQLTGSEFDMQGLKELQALLGGV